MSISYTQISSMFYGKTTNLEKISHFLKESRIPKESRFPKESKGIKDSKGIKKIFFSENWNVLQLPPKPHILSVIGFYRGQEASHRILIEIIVGKKKSTERSFKVATVLPRIPNEKERLIKLVYVNKFGKNSSSFWKIVIWKGVIR